MVDGKNHLPIRSANLYLIFGSISYATSTKIVNLYLSARSKMKNALLKSLERINITSGPHPSSADVAVSTNLEKEMQDEM